MKPIQTAVIGFGLSARVFHLPFLAVSPAFQLRAISTSQGEAVQAAWPGVRVYDSAEALLQATDAELLIITAPNQAHYPLASQALDRGLHVLIEKPFVPTVAEGEALIEQAEAQGRVLSVFHNRRWDGDFLTVEALIKSGRLGQIHVLESRFDRFRPTVQSRWREQPGPAAGVWYDLGAHLLDQALCLFGLPQALSARCLALRENALVTDYFHVTLHYPGCEVLLHASPFVAGSTLRFWVQGKAGSYRKYGLDPQEERLKQGLLPEQADWAAEVPTDYGLLAGPDGESPYPTLTGGYQRYFDQLARAIRDEGPVPVPATEALTVIRLLALAERSSAEGRTLSC